MKMGVVCAALALVAAGCTQTKVCKPSIGYPEDVPVAEIAAIDAMTGEQLTEKREFVLDGYRLPYRLHAPATLAAEHGCKLYPLVLFLHGAGERGRDNTATLVHGVVPICKYAMKHGDAFVVAPQCPENRRWVDRDWGAKEMRRPNAPTEEMAAVMALLGDIVQRYPIDPDRIYVTGISMGGFGTWDIVPRLEKKFAAMMPICGGVDERTAHLYADRELGIRFFHGGADSVVSPDFSRRMDEALTRAGKVHRYIEYPGVDHDSWTRTYADEDNLFWLFSQRRSYASRTYWPNCRVK